MVVSSEIKDIAQLSFRRNTTIVFPPCKTHNGANAQIIEFEKLTFKKRCIELASLILSLFRSLLNSPRVCGTFVVRRHVSCGQTRRQRPHPKYRPNERNGADSFVNVVRFAVNRDLHACERKKRSNLTSNDLTRKATSQRRQGRLTGNESCVWPQISIRHKY